MATSKVLPRFLSTLSALPTPVLLDLGPVVGTNVTFLGETLGCKLFVEDLYAVVDKFPPDAREDLPRALEARLTHEPGSIDGVLVWDLFDILDRPASTALAARLVALLRKGGLLYGFFGTAPGDVTHHTRFVVESANSLRLRRSPAARPVRRNVLVNRDINRMFEGLEPVESVLLKSSTRETMFRKL